MSGNFWINFTLPNIISALTTQHATFLSEFSALTNNADRMEFCLSEKVIQGWIGSFLSRFSSKKDGLKCSITAATIRSEGNGRFRAKNYQEAIQLYSAAICYAPQSMDTASEVALLYANRSAAYLQVGQYENALKDIDAALEFGYARFKPVTKLQLRKCDCLIRLGRAREAKEFLLFMQQPTKEKSDSDRWVELFGGITLDDKKKNESSMTEISFIEKLTQKDLFKPSEKMSSLSTKVAVCYDAEKGRHLVAQEDIQFGEILGITRPYVALFDSQDDTGRCQHCGRDFFPEDTKMTASLRSVPCTNCSNVMFCSEECHAESSNSYHRYECGQYALLGQFSKPIRMALRILYRAGMDQIRAVVSAEHAKDSSYFSVQPEDHYSHVYHLVHHSDGQLFDLDVPYAKMLESSLVACILFHLAKRGHFPMKTKEDEKLIGGLMLRHLFQMRYNIFLHGSDPLSSTSPSYLFPVFSSSLNHSCKENARLELPTNKNNICFLQAARPISAGTEITIPYLNDQNIRNGEYNPDRNSGVDSKVHDLLDRYGFQCRCAQCKYQIRNMPFGVFRYVPLRCTDCGHLMELFSEQRSESQIFRCINCSFEMTNAEVKRRYGQQDQLRRLHNQLLDQISIPNVAQQDSLFRLLESNIERLESWIHCESCFVTGYMHVTMAIHYQKIGQLDKWWICNERYLTLTERLYGEESLRFIQEFERFQLILAETIEKDTKLMENFKQQHNKFNESYLARVDQWKQLKLKYCAGY